MKSQEKQKTYYDIRARANRLQIADRVLVKILAHDGRHKISDNWEPDVYCIIEQPNLDIPVFVVQREELEGRKRTLHRNNLLPIGNKMTDKPPLPRKPEVLPKSPRQSTSNKSPEVSENNVASEDDLIINIVPCVDTDDGQDAGSVSHVESADSNHPDETPEVQSCEDAYPLDVRTEDLSSESESEQNSPDADRISVRRSVRNRTQPSWLSSGEYITNMFMKESKDQDWVSKVNFLKCLAESPSFQDHR